MYAYHYQDVERNLIFRYDNAAHRLALPYPAHKHTQSGDAEVSPYLRYPRFWTTAYGRRTRERSLAGSATAEEWSRSSDTPP
jgi:hypothetical protein